MQDRVRNELYMRTAETISFFIHQGAESSTIRMRSMRDRVRNELSTRTAGTKNA